ncbi:MAG: hypothetical protein AB2L24_21860 [Mangrovibacterium sp.]
MITDFFQHVSELRDFAPQMPTDSRIEALEAHYRPQYQKLINLIGTNTYDALKAFYVDNPDDSTSMKGKAVSFLRGALANLTAIPYFAFEAGQRNNTENKLYRYQEDKQIETYLENAWTELNFLLDHLEANIAEFPVYAETEQYMLRQTLFIKNAREFKRYYGAVNSSYFFNNVVFIIEEIQNDEIKSRVKTFPAIESDKMKWVIGKAIAYETLARACIQLDYTELPAGIRADVQKDTDTRTIKITESDIKSGVAAYFRKEAGKYFLQIEEENNRNRNAGTYTLPKNTVTETDKFYMP